MGLLDDLRNQAEGKRAADEEAAARKAEREQYYQEKILPRMIKAYQFFNEFVEHLNYINLETHVNYPLMPDGRPQLLRQEGYTVVIDSSKALKRIDFSMEGVLIAPIQFEIFGKDAVLKHADRLERYAFRHDRKDKKDPTSMELVAAKFTLLGPLPLKITVEADVDNQQIIVTIRNFNEPGFSKYNLTVEQFSDEFLDQLGKFVLRKEDRLFGKSEELTEEARKKLRDRMIVEARIREQEMIEAEERRKAEEAAEKEKSAKEQIKRAVNTQKEQLKRVMNTQVSKGKESLREMFSKLKKQASTETPTTQATQQTPPAEPAAKATPQPTPTPARPGQTARQGIIEPVARRQENPQAAVTQPASAQRATVTNTAPNKTNQQATVKPAIPTQTKPQSTGTTTVSAQQSPQPMTARTQVPEAPDAVKTPKQPARTPVVNPQSSPQPPVTVDVKTETAQTAEPAVKPAVEKKIQPPKVYTAPPGNPFIKPEPPEESPAPAAADKEQQELSSQDKAQSEAVTDTAPRPDLTPEALEEDLARILDRDNQKDVRVAPKTKPAVAAIAPNPLVQSSAQKEVEVKQEDAAVSADKPKPVLKPGELNTSLSESMQIDIRDKIKEVKPVNTGQASTQNPFLKAEDLDIDLSDNLAPPQSDDPKENS